MQNRSTWFKIADKTPPNDSYILVSSSKCPCQIVLFVGEEGLPTDRKVFKRMTHWQYLTDGLICNKCVSHMQ